MTATDNPVPETPVPAIPSPAIPSPADDALAALWPLFGLRVTCGDLEMRPFRDADLPEYAALLRGGIFADPRAAHRFPWTQVPADELVPNSVRFHWSLRAGTRPERWTIPFAVRRAGVLVGQQDVSAREFATTRCVTSGSWLGITHQGRGTGRAMRQAMLVFAFDHLGATRAESAAGIGNAASRVVSQRCGYLENGTQLGAEFREPHEQIRFLCTPDTVVRPEQEVTVTGLEACRALLGI